MSGFMFNCMLNLIDPHSSVSNFMNNCSRDFKGHDACFKMHMLVD